MFQDNPELFGLLSYAVHIGERVVQAEHHELDVDS